MSDRRLKPGARLHVPVEPLAERDWDRLERRLESERERELAAAPVADLRSGARRLALVTMLTVGVAAGMALMWWRSAGEPSSAPSVAQGGIVAAPAATPTRVITPPGGSSRLALGDATVEVAGDTELTVENAVDGAITVRLARGTVDCEVTPRPGRSAFHVVADDVVVTVVGTRFSVERSAAAGGVRVGVTRGKVSVASAGAVTAQVVAGQEWHARTGVTVAPEVAAAAPVVDAGPRDRATVPSADASPAVDPSMPLAEALAEAATIEATDPDAAAARYRQLVLAPGADAAELEEAAYRLARVELGRARWDAAIAAARAYEERFPRGARLEEVLWFRVEASCGAYKSRAAEAAARAYAAKFPDGAHAAEAKSLAVCKGVIR